MHLKITLLELTTQAHKTDNKPISSLDSFRSHNAVTMKESLKF